MQDFTDGMRQTIAFNMKYLQVTDPVLLAATREGDLDRIVTYLESIQPPSTEDETPDSGAVDSVADDAVDLDDVERDLASNTKFMIPMIHAWQIDLGRRPASP